METTPYTGVPAAPAYPVPTGYAAPEYAAPEYPAPDYPPPASPAPEYAAPAYPAPTSDTAVPDYSPPAPVEASAPTTYPGSHSAPEAPAYDPPVGYPATPAAPAHAATPAAFLPEPDPELVAETVPDPAEQAVAPPAGAVVSHGRASTEQSEREGDFSLIDALTIMLERGASDLHITTGAKPTIRISGSLVALDDFPVLTPPVIQRVMYSIITQAQREKFEEVLELDFAYSLPGRARFRVNMFRQRDSVGGAFRIIPFEIKSLESLGVPPSVANFAGLPRGFVLVTGPTGSGKSTTLAALVDLANRTRHDHIMTVEDPIEFLHKHKSCLINQREVGEDTWSFTNALKHVLRQDPDIILVGEMRDLETISVALTAAETGHLVFATLHTQDAAQTIDRIIDVFPPHQQQQVRSQLAMALQGVVCQTLAKTADGHGRVVATEVLVVTPAVRNLIREGKSHQIYSVMQAGAAHGMHTLDQHLADLVRTRRITYEVGLEKCHHIEDFNRLCGRA